MSPTKENADFAIGLDDSGVLLYAGGATGLVLLDGTGEQAVFWAGLAEHAEDQGLSALAFAEPVIDDPAAGAARAARLLRRLGVDRLLIVAAGADAKTALQAAASGDFAGLALLDPAIPADQLEGLLEHTPMPKLVIVTGSNDAQARAIYRHAVGPTVIRHLTSSSTRRGGEVLTGESAELAEEAILGFAFGVCGDGRPG